MQKLLISVRGPKEAIEAAKGGAHIADVEYPISALGTPYPLNIFAVRNKLNHEGYAKILTSTNIGERQHDRASTCQAALGVATAGADIIKCGLAELPLQAAVYQGESFVRTVKKFYPKKKVIPAVFVDKDLRRFFEPFRDSQELVSKIKADGILLDTFNKSIGRGLLDSSTTREIADLVTTFHDLKKEVWIASSITLKELPELWATDVDVICIRGAACEQRDIGRFGEVKAKIVMGLMETIP
jgi:(5-formylfuran-3-yl)methyl phosphate synthase